MFILVTVEELDEAGIKEEKIFLVYPLLNGLPFKKQMGVIYYYYNFRKI